jgi:hypothetical protein
VCIQEGAVLEIPAKSYAVIFSKQVAVLVKCSVQWFTDVTSGGWSVCEVWVGTEGNTVPFSLPHL